MPPWIVAEDRHGGDPLHLRPNVGRVCAARDFKKEFAKGCPRSAAIPVLFRYRAAAAAVAQLEGVCIVKRFQISCVCKCASVQVCWPIQINRLLCESRIPGSCAPGRFVSGSISRMRTMSEPWILPQKLGGRLLIHSDRDDNSCCCHWNLGASFLALASLRIWPNHYLHKQQKLCQADERQQQ